MKATYERRLCRWLGRCFQLKAMPSEGFFSPTKPLPAVFAPPSAERPSSLSAQRWARLRRAIADLFRREPTELNVVPSMPVVTDVDLRHNRLAPQGPTPDKHSDFPSTTPEFINTYFSTLSSAWRDHDWTNVVRLNEALQSCWRENRQLFLCGNGGSAANAIHLANDLLYGVDKQSGRGLRVTALPANAAVLTCLANDIAYEDIFAQQLTVLAQPGDVLLAFSGSGNSPNIVKALTRAREIGVTTFAVLGFTGGHALKLADHPIYFPVHDMQVAEDLQMMIGHMAMQWLSRQRRG